jgi:hypothetical protein
MLKKNTTKLKHEIIPYFPIPEVCSLAVVDYVQHRCAT